MKRHAKARRVTKGLISRYHSPMSFRATRLNLCSAVVAIARSILSADADRPVLAYGGTLSLDDELKGE